MQLILLKQLKTPPCFKAPKQQKQFMRFFKHGDSLALVIPDFLKTKAGIKEGDEYEWVEVEKGLFALASKEFIREHVRGKLASLISAQQISQINQLSQTSQPTALKTPPARTTPASTTPVNNYLLETLNKKGFLVVANENEVKALTQAVEKDVKNGAVLGVRGFDKKYYLCTRAFLEEQTPKVLKILSAKDASAEEAAQALKQPLDATLSLIQVLKEQGEILEKKRGMYAAVK